MKLPGIKKIYSVETSTLTTQIESRAIAGLEIGVYSGLKEIPFFGEAVCDTKQKYDNNGVTEDTELEFATAERLNTEKPLAFVIQDVNDRYFLIGTYEPPFTIITQSQSTSDPAGSNTCWIVNVRYIGLRTLINCLVNI